MEIKICAGENVLTQSYGAFYRKEDIYLRQIEGREKDEKGKNPPPSFLALFSTYILYFLHSLLFISSFLPTLITAF